MIMEKESEIKVLRNFCNNPYDYFTIAEISDKTGISRNWTYTVINKFRNSGILLESGKKCKLDFSSIFPKRLKMSFDAEYLISLGKLGRSILSTANKLIFETSPKSVVLVGSVASGKAGKGSDIDFLVISEGGSEKVPHFENVNVILLSEKEFREKYLKGDDFVISSLAFGRVIHDAGAFTKFLESPLPIFSQELIQEKIKYCENLEERIYSLLRTDEARALSELLYLALQAARVILLKNKVIPKTKHDIALQVAAFDKNMARIIRELLQGKKIEKEGILRYVKECMSVV
jgi:predicted nucleotidyltransferase/predicted DNA-binding transcriptional regulator AlpA